jgi:hypothetical protein
VAEDPTVAEKLPAAEITAAAIELEAATTAAATPDKTEAASMSAAAELATTAANPGDITAAADVEIGTKTGVKAVTIRGAALRELSKVWAGERRFMSIGEIHMSVLLRNLCGKPRGAEDLNESFRIQL